MINILEEFENRVAPLKTRKADGENKLERLLRARADEAERNAAKLGVLSRELEEAVANGKTKQADTKRQEVQDLRANQARVAAEIESTREEIAHLAEEMGKVAREVLNALLPQIQQEIVAKMNDALDFRDSHLAMLKAFEREANIFLNGSQRDALKFKPYFQTQKVSERLEKAF